MNGEVMADDDNNGALHRDMGRLEGRMDSLEQRQARFEGRMDKAIAGINDKLDLLANSWLSGKAAWKTISILAGVVVFGSSIAMWGISEYRAWVVEEQIDQAVEDEL